MNLPIVTIIVIIYSETMYIVTKTLNFYYNITVTGDIFRLVPFYSLQLNESIGIVIIYSNLYLI